jgi:multidrug resistance efflux pump
MDIARPELRKRKRQRQMLFGGIGLVALIVITLGLARLEPAAPKVERATLYTGTIQRGEMVRQVRGNGSLIPERIVYVQAETDGRVERIAVLPGAAVEPDTIILELSNRELEQLVFDLEWQMKAAKARLKMLKIQLESERLTQQSNIASLQGRFTQAKLEAEADVELAGDGLIPRLTMKRSLANASELERQLEIEGKRLVINAESAVAQIEVQNADLAKLDALLALKRQQLGSLKVKAGIKGVLQQIGDTQTLQVGQRIGPTSTLAKIVQPLNLKAEIKIAETQARDVQIGQRAEIDTRNGVIPGIVSRVDPSVLAGTVTVDVRLEGPLPKGARPDLSVDGMIELERLEDVLYVSRPVHGQADSTIGLFRIESGGKEAVRVQVGLGRSSVSTIEITRGLEIGDEVILSDMSQWDDYNQLRLR